MQAPDRTDRADQETLLKTFFRDNLRVGDDVAFDETAVEDVAFAIAVVWTLDLDFSETEQHGAYKGDSSTIFTTSPEQLARETEGYASRLLQDPATYAVACAAIDRLPDRGLRHDGKLAVRNEAAKLAYVYPCGTCKGKGKTTCRTCSGSGRVDCSLCSGSGTTTCGTCSGSGRVSSSSSSSETTYRSCSCQGGRVRCSRCSGNRKVRCGGCSGEGHNTCTTCKGSGQRSTIRDLSLIAEPVRSYRFAEATSTFARDILSRDTPANLAAQVYTGSWDDAPAIEATQRAVTYALNATTRFLESRVRFGEQTFSFRTYGVTLRVADGGGIVEHILEADKHALEAAANASPLANPFGWFAHVKAATENVLASRIHMLALARHYGSRNGEELLNSLSADYAKEIVAALVAAFRKVDFLLSVLPWICSLAVAVLVLVLRLHGMPSPLSLPVLETAVADVPVYAAFVIAALTALVYFVSRALPAFAFSDPKGDNSLQALIIVRGRSMVKSAVFAGIFALVAFAIAVGF